MMKAPELLIGASVQLVVPLAEAQDPGGRSDAGRAVVRLADVAWLEMASDASSPGWAELLDRLGEVADGHEVTSRDGEDFIALAASQVGTALEMLAAGAVDADLCWQELESIYSVVEGYRLEQDLEPFLLDWLSSVRSTLIGTDGAMTNVDHARQVLDAQIASVRPFVAEAFSSSIADDDW